ncbi:MAG: hypothetical protein GY795_05670 [Desulfobacterales bacterium]|nr:hypothetical protein [Desulfobacterales bacterium]
MRLLNGGRLIAAFITQHDSANCILGKVVVNGETTSLLRRGRMYTFGVERSGFGRERPCFGRAEEKNCRVAKTLTIVRIKVQTDK